MQVYSGRYKKGMVPEEILRPKQMEKEMINNRKRKGRQT